jgi:hypothetical protein
MSRQLAPAGAEQDGQGGHKNQDGAGQGQGQGQGAQQLDHQQQSAQASVPITEEEIVGFREQDRFLPINNIQRCEGSWNNILCGTNALTSITQTHEAKSARQFKDKQGCQGWVINVYQASNTPLTKLFPHRMHPGSHLRVHQLHHIRSCRSGY